MVILTERQKQILSLLLTNSEGFSVKELEDHLHVSRRTVYREFNNLRSILARADLELVNEKHKYSIQGGQLALNKLKEEVQTTKEQSSMTMEQRESALVVLLLLADEPQKIIQLALELQVSEATV
ncbi:HTH domain-containing protein, partial [Lactobacillus acetotolerans]